jgi:hypothetical protein
MTVTQAPPYVAPTPRDHSRSRQAWELATNGHRLGRGRVAVTVEPCQQWMAAGGVDAASPPGLMVAFGA